MRNTNSLPKATFESAWASIQEMTKAMKAMQEETRVMQEVMQEETRAKQKTSEKERKELRDSIKAMQQELGGMSKSNGEVAEAYFIDSISKSLQFAGQKFDSYSSNLNKKDAILNLQGEYDLVLFNCTSVVIVEIKYKARIKDIEELLKKVNIFKQLYPQYANYNMYLGLAAFRLNKDVVNSSIEHGIAVIKQVGDAMVINDAHLRVY